MKISFRLFAVLLCLSPFSSVKAGDGVKSSVEEAIRKGGVSISPIYSQIVMFSLPGGFRTVFENTNGDSYIRNAVPNGQSMRGWSQMITVTGARGLAARNVSARAFAEAIASGFRRSCPNSFSFEDLGPATVTGLEAHAAVASCGTLQARDRAAHSETALLFAVKGSSDVYSIQWAEVGAPSAQPRAVDAAKWRERRARLEPIKVCPHDLGESAPYPSCLNQK